MALWGKTDALASVPTWLEDAAANTNKSNDRDNAIFVDLTEAAIAGNRAKGITGPGWWFVSWGLRTSPVAATSPRRRHLDLSGLS